MGVFESLAKQSFNIPSLGTNWGIQLFEEIVFMILFGFKMGEALKGRGEELVVREKVG